MPLDSCLAIPVCDLHARAKLPARTTWAFTASRMCISALLLHTVRVMQTDVLCVLCSLASVLLQVYPKGTLSSGPGLSIYVSLNNTVWLYVAICVAYAAVCPMAWCCLHDRLSCSCLICAQAWSMPLYHASICPTRKPCKHSSDNALAMHAAAHSDADLHCGVSISFKAISQSPING